MARKQKSPSPDSTLPIKSLDHSEASIIADTIARLIRARILANGDVPRALQTVGISPGELTEALRIHNTSPVPRIAAPSRLRISYIGNGTPHPTSDRTEVVDFVDIIQDDENKNRVIASPRPYPSISGSGSSRVAAMAEVITHLCNLADGLYRREAELLGNLAKVNDLVAKLRAEANGERATPDVAPLPEPTPERPSRPRPGGRRPERTIDGERWLYCRCMTGCGPLGTGWNPEDSFPPRSDAPHLRRPLTVECYSAYHRSRRVTVAALDGLAAVGIAFRYDRAGSPTSIECTICGETLVSGDYVVSAGPVPLNHVGCARHAHG